MSGKHDKSVDEDQSANLLMTGPIVIRGLGRSVKDAFRPGRPSRHRAFVGEEPAAAPLAIESGESSGSEEQITYEVDALFRSDAGVPQTGEDAGPGEDRVDDRADDAPPADTDVEQPWDGTGERSGQDAASEESARESDDESDAPVGGAATEADGAGEPVADDEPDPVMTSEEPADGVGDGSVVAAEDASAADERAAEDSAIEQDESDGESDEDAMPDGSAEQDHLEETASEAPAGDFGDGEPASQEPVGEESALVSEETSGDEPSVIDGGTPELVSDGEPEVVLDAEHEGPEAAEAPVVDFGDGEPASQDPADEESEGTSGEESPVVGGAPELAAEDEVAAAPDTEQDGADPEPGAAEALESEPSTEHGQEQDLVPTEQLAAPGSDAAPEQDVEEQGIGVEVAEARIEAIAASEPGVTTDPVDDWFIPPSEDGSEPEHDETQRAEESPGADDSATDGAHAVDAAEPVVADVPDGAESDSFDALDGGPTDEIAATHDPEQHPDESAVDGTATAGEQTAETSAESDVAGEGSGPVAEESAADPEEPAEPAPFDGDAAAAEVPVEESSDGDDEDPEDSSAEEPEDAQPADESPEADVEGVGESDVEPEDGLDDTTFGDDPADADVAADEQQPAVEPASEDDSVLAAYLGQRDWTTAEELYSRPITLPVPPDGPASDVVDSLPAEEQPVGVEDAPEADAQPIGDEAPLADGETVAEDDDAGPIEDEGPVAEDTLAAPAAGESPVADDAPAEEPAEAAPTDVPVALPVATAVASAPKAASRPPRGPRQPRPRPVRERFGREAIGIAVLVVLALICGGLITAVVLKTQNDARIAAAEAANYTPPPLATPTPAATGPVVAVIGDGSTSTAASGVASADRWSALVGTALKGTVTTDASNGMGYAAKGSSGETFVQAAGKVPSNADVVIFFGGASDANIAPLSLAKAATDAMSAAKQQAPSAKIIVVGPAIASGASTADLTTVRNTLKSAAGIVKATWIDPIDASWLSTSKQGASSPSSLTAADEKAIASKMEAAIKSALG